MANSAEEPYQYSPITDSDGIRLIVLQPSRDEAAQVQCSLIHTTLRRAREEIHEHYTALSYVWGDPNDTTSISILGCSLQVTANLECALRYLRDETRELHVWADGICINQGDNDEKGKQVQQMGQVYEVAHHTVIFLGECDAATEQVLAQMVSCCEKGILYPNRDEGEKSLKQILARPWFYRVWILQELVMSQDPRVQFCRLRFSWRVLSQLMDSFSDNEARSIDSDELGLHACLSDVEAARVCTAARSLSRALEVVNQMNNAKQNFERSKVDSRYSIRPGYKKFSDAPVDSERGSHLDVQKIKDGFEVLLSILETRRGFQVSDSRDRVYANLGLVDYIDFRTDYRMNCRQVFELFAKRHIAATRTYEIFKHIEDCDPINRLNGLATWAPDWSYRELNPRYRPLPEKGWKHLAPFHKDRNDIQGNKLKVAATRLSSIMKLSSVLDTSYYSSSSDGPVWDACEWMARSIGAEVTLFRDCIAFGLEIDHPFSILVQELHEHHRTHGSILDGRRLAVLNDTRRSFALVPACSKKGDHIYFTENCTFPFVLRDVESGCKARLGVAERAWDVYHMVGVCMIEMRANVLPWGPFDRILTIY